MSDGDRFPTDLQESTEELRSYLADEIPPLLAADAVELLVRRAPEALTALIQGWLTFHHQARRGAVRYADLAFHALRRLHLLGELGLAPKPELESYLAALIETLVPLCPPEDREVVRITLERLRQGTRGLSDSAFHVGAAGSSEAAGARWGDPGAPPAELAQELRRFALLLARVKPAAGGEGSGGAAAAPAEGLVAALVAAAATSARDGAELGKYLEHLRQLGIAGVDPAGVVRTLSRALPAWAPETPPAPAALGGSAKALHRFVDLAEAPMQRLARFEGVVGALVEELNTGSLARAVALVHVAAGLLAENRVPPADAEGVRRRAQDSLDAERLRAYALDPQHRPLLLQLMDFFPGLRPDGLLEALEDEPDRVLRRLRLTLIELHGAAARPVILERMAGALTDMREIGWYWQRNLVYLLHRIPCPQDALEERELDYVLQFSELANQPRVVGEAVIRLGQIPHERAVGALLARLREVEAGIEAGGLPQQSLDDLERLRVLVATQLLRGGSPAARRAVVQAALRRLRDAGDPGRLAELRTVDLAADPDLVDELLQALRERLPRKLLGVALRRNTGLLTELVESLSSTPTAAVRRCLEELTEQYPRESFGIDASRVLAGFDGPPAAEARPETTPGAAAPASPAPQRMEGDLQLFSLPNLLQSLAQNELSGTLTLRDARGVTAAVLELHRGALTYCATGRLQGEIAFYQLLERQAATSFAFEGGEAPAREGGGAMAPREIIGMLIEGMRRLDEYQRARALVPDPAVLVPTGTRPSSLPGETDGAFVRELWGLVKSGASAAACEEALAADAYRVRTLLAHWLTGGAVELSPLDAPPATA
ncbi:MAG TPA: DUF4388 domain-containing protein [Thermoanaerobaculia bacterium]|nr:DUF4388 domain-containing protein [Thermoanaerobaculia bacterium]